MGHQQIQQMILQIGLIQFGVDQVMESLMLITHVQPPKIPLQLLDQHIILIKMELIRSTHFTQLLPTTNGFNTQPS